MKPNLKNYWKIPESEYHNIEEWLTPAKEAENLAKNLKKGKILDMGCGLGRHTLYFAQRGFEVIAFDGSEDAVAHTKDWLKKEKLQAEVSLSTFSDWNYGENEYEAILSFNAFHHGTEEEVRSLAKRIAKGLKKGGVFIANVPSTRNIKEEDKQIERQTYTPNSGPEEGIPHFFFSQKDVYKFFPDFEIQIKTVSFQNNLDTHFDIFARKK